LSVATRLSYSIFLAVVISAISYVLYDRGGELVLWPGLLTQVVLNGVLLLAIPSGDDYYSLPSRAYLVFNVTFYASIIFGLLLLIGQNSVKKKVCELTLSIRQQV
jgi:hypothetical protein